MKYSNFYVKKTFAVMAAVLFLLSFTGCKDDSPEIIDDITVDEDNYTVIYTNNSSYCGYTIRIDTDDLTSFLNNYIETETVKVSGSSSAYYGLYFNGSLDASDYLSNFIAVYVNTEGSYMVVKCIDGTYYGLNVSGTWSTTRTEFASSELLQGYNQSNVIKVVVTAAGEYDLYLNDAYVKSFTETGITTGLKKGFMFGVDSQDKEGFPDNFLKIKFKELAAE